jgi:hypothetical protein
MTTGSNLQLTTCTINTKSYPGAYIAMQSLNPISQLHATTGTWYYYPVTAMYDSTGAPITFTSADTVTIKFDPTTLSTTAKIYTFLQSQGGKCGTSGTNHTGYVQSINGQPAYNYGGGGGGGAGGQIYSYYLNPTSTSYSATVNLYPTSSTSKSYYSYNTTTISAGNGGAGGNGGNASSSATGNGGAGGNATNIGAGGISSYYYGGGGGNGGASGNPQAGATSYGSDGFAGSGKQPGGSNGQSGSSYAQTPGSTTVTFADNTTASVGRGGKGGGPNNSNSSMAPTAGAGANFMVYFTA